jgi:3'(2'), 5'-bisphosphate nucleotidase
MAMINISEANFLPSLIEISKMAGKAIMEVYESKEGFDVHLKSDESPLTVADQRANDIIVRELKLLFPGTPIISEENKQLDYSQRQSFTQYWVVDPLDGTKEFIKRNGEFTVNIALCEGNLPIAGVVYLPVTQEIYYACKGQGAFKGPYDSRQQLSAPEFSIKDEGLTVVVSRSHLSEATEDFLSALTHPQTLATGSSLKFLKIAEGSAHLYPRLGPTMEWDTAAAQIVLEEAGGSVTNTDNGAALEYNKKDLLNPYFLAAGKMNDA